MPGKLHAFLEGDHQRLDALLRASSAAEAIDLAAFEVFREGLLRHIGMEEKVLLPAARRLHGGEVLEQARQIRLDHSALAALLVPTPTGPIIARLREVLAAHNALEEAPGGLYATCDALAESEADALVERMRSAPAVPLAPHHDSERSLAAIERLLRAAGR